MIGMSPLQREWRRPVLIIKARELKQRPAALLPSASPAVCNRRPACSFSKAIPAPQPTPKQTRVDQPQLCSAYHGSSEVRGPSATKEQAQRACLYSQQGRILHMSNTLQLAATCTKVKIFGFWNLQSMNHRNCAPSLHLNCRSAEAGLTVGAVGIVACFVLFQIRTLVEGRICWQGKTMCELSQALAINSASKLQTRA